MKLPTQPLVLDQRGVLRFQENRLITKLLDCASKGIKFDLNDAAIYCMKEGISPEEEMQLAQLIGYSVSGFEDLSYVDSKTISKIERKRKRFYENTKKN